MNGPSLVLYDTPKDYRSHYEKFYCRACISTADGIRVYFKPEKFGHAFYENSQRTQGPKDQFSFSRAQRIDWIRLTLEHPSAALYVGWNKHNRCYDENRRVSVVYESFVVVIELSINKSGELKGNFITCYYADDSIQKIKESPILDKEKCLNSLQKNRR